MKSKVIYTLRNTYSDCEISRHRSLEAAIRARIKHSRAVKRRNGANSFVPYAITASDGSSVFSAIAETEHAILY